MSHVMGTEIKLTDGIISSLSGYYNNKSYYQITAPIQPGNSGGPLFNQDGYLIGVVTSKLSDGDNVGYVLKSDVLMRFINRQGVSVANSTRVINSNLLADKVKVLKNSIVIIEAER
jgi:S1-C subfamily serine protease